LRHPVNWCIYDNVFTWDIPKAIANFEKHGVPFAGCSKRSFSAAAAREEAKRTLRRTLSL